MTQYQMQLSEGESKLIRLFDKGLKTIKTFYLFPKQGSDT